MHTNTAIVNVILFITLGISSTLGVDEFRGAVVEYSAIYENTSRDTVISNIENYASIVKELKTKYSDLVIIVFPEDGLASVEWEEAKNKSLIYGATIPDINPNISLCDTSSSAPKIIQTLACIAKNSSVYLVVNLIEKSTKNSTDVLYNTNIVFSSQGALIARYRKYNLFAFEKNTFEKPEKPEIVYFDTNFGVRFGIFTCFDIIFKRPGQDIVNGDYGLSHVVYPTAWVNELPFLTAVQEQSSWSYGTNKVLMAAGLHHPKYGCTGTGIYLGKLGSNGDTTFKKRSVQSQIQGNFAIVSYIPKTLNNIEQYSGRSEIYHFYNTSNPGKINLSISRDNLEVYTTEIISTLDNIQPLSESLNVTLFSKTAVNKTVCNRDLCCHFEFQITKGYCLEMMMPPAKEIVGEEFGQYQYRLAVFNGVKNYDGTSTGTGGVQVCSIISCLDNNQGSCGKRTEDGTPDSIMVNFGSYYKYYQCYTEFEDVKINAKLSNQNSFVSSNILISSNHYMSSTDKSKRTNDYIKFGEIADPSLYTISKGSDDGNLTYYEFTTTGIIRDPASINLYNRLFDLDGQEATKKSDPSSASNLNLSSMLFVGSFLAILLRNIN